jgi:ribonuclease HI
MQVIDNITTKGKKPKTKIEQRIRKLFESKNKVYSVQIQWVKSHGECAGNNLIDQKLEQEMVVLISKLKPQHRNLVVERVKSIYQLKVVFERFSQEFFTSLLG